MSFLTCCCYVSYVIITLCYYVTYIITLYCCLLQLAPQMVGYGDGWPKQVSAQPWSELFGGTPVRLDRPMLKKQLCFAFAIHERRQQMETLLPAVGAACHALQCSNRRGEALLLQDGPLQLTDHRLTKTWCSAILQNRTLCCLCTDIEQLVELTFALLSHQASLLDFVPVSAVSHRLQKQGSVDSGIISLLHTCLAGSKPASCEDVLVFKQGASARRVERQRRVLPSVAGRRQRRLKASEACCRTSALLLCTSWSKARAPSRRSLSNAVQQA